MRLGFFTAFPLKFPRPAVKINHRIKNPGIHNAKMPKTKLAKSKKLSKSGREFLEGLERSLGDIRVGRVIRVR